MKVYRVQDRDGRGPFKPGFSKVWSDPDFAPGQLPLPPWPEEFGMDAIDRLAKPHENYFGSAVRTVGKLRSWFSDAERERLADLGYHIAAIPHARVLAESPNQLLIASQTPFYVCLVIPWFMAKQMVEG